MAADGRVALVTGAARGIGFEVCRALAREGMAVLLSARDPAKAAAAAEELAGDGDVRPLALDVADDASVAAAAAAIDADPGRLDVLVNNAAAYADWRESPSTADLAVARQVMDVNLFGAWRMVEAMLPLLRAGERPRLVNVTSGAARTRIPSSAWRPSTAARRPTASPRRRSTPSRPAWPRSSPPPP